MPTPNHNQNSTIKHYFPAFHYHKKPGIYQNNQNVNFIFNLNMATQYYGVVCATQFVKYSLSFIFYSKLKEYPSF